MANEPATSNDFQMNRPTIISLLYIGSFLMGITTVIGVIEDLARPNRVDQGPYAMIFALRGYGPGLHYILRTEPGRRADVLKAAVAALKKADPNTLVVNEDTFDEIRAGFFERDRSMAWMLAAR